MGLSWKREKIMKFKHSFFYDFTDPTRNLDDWNNFKKFSYLKNVINISRGSFLSGVSLKVLS
jgi:hypothetical protein